MCNILMKVKFGIRRLQKSGTSYWIPVPPQYVNTVGAGKGTDGHGYVLGDYTIHDTPQKWAQAAITAYNKHEANTIAGEVNNGGDLVEMNIKTVDPSIPFQAVHASRGKAIRAEPISSLYQQNRIHHFGTFPQLEDQMCEWIPGEGKSPDRLDGAVWALTLLNLNPYAVDSAMSDNQEVGYDYASSKNYEGIWENEGTQDTYLDGKDGDAGYWDN
jgi:hypothetical protein